jgi:uncharacterized membrane protein (UPF0127 family)
MKRLIVTIACLFFAANASAEGLTQATVHTPKKDIPLTLEVAASQAEREHGLMQRKTLKPHDGMVFQFAKNGFEYFWMKDTLIPLDMVFLDNFHTVVYIVHSAKPLDTASLGPSTPVRAVIELDGGRTAKDGIAVGDVIDYVLPPDTHVEDAPLAW